MCIPKPAISKWICIALCTFCLFACEQKTEDNIAVMATRFSILECRAFTLRELRFVLADKIRFAEDTIAKLPPGAFALKNLQSQLKVYLHQKESTLAQSLQLADSIKLQLDTIIKIRLQSTDKIRRFDKALLEIMEKKHCR